MNAIYYYAPVASLVAFFAAFLWIAYCAYRPAAKKTLQSHAFIPLKEDRHD
jgi:cbb3-type cytochrome oxidase subunit 3